MGRNVWLRRGERAGERGQRLNGAVLIRLSKPPSEEDCGIELNALGLGRLAGLVRIQRVDRRADH